MEEQGEEEEEEGEEGEEHGLGTWLAKYWVPSPRAAPQAVESIALFPVKNLGNILNVIFITENQVLVKKNTTLCRFH